MCVVFDIGGVLVPQGDRMDRLSGRAAELIPGLDRDAFVSAFWEVRDPYDLGQSDAEYWARVFDKAGLAEFPDDEVVEELAELDGNVNGSASEEAAEILAGLGWRGVHLGLLSNAPYRMADAVERSSWAAPVTTAVFSAREGLAKPDERIYELAHARLEEDAKREIPRGDVLFFDDREVNVAAARSFGWVAHQFKNYPALNAVLDEHLGDR